MKNFPRLLLRLSVGGFFIGHGLMKLTKLFGGHGLDATAGMTSRLTLGYRDAVAVTGS